MSRGQDAIQNHNKNTGDKLQHSRIWEQRWRIKTAFTKKFKAEST
jgi:hypothetical protein